MLCITIICMSFQVALILLYLDSYKYDILNDKWHRIDDCPISFAASSSIIKDNKLIIVGGCNKEIYDNAILNLSNDDFKAIYFSMDINEFHWNNDLYEFDFETEKFSLKEKIQIQHYVALNYYK